MEIELKDRLKLSRAAKGLTQQEVASALNIDKSTYCGYETGKRKPDVDRLRELSLILEVTADYLIGAEHKKSATGDGDGLSADRQLILHAFDKLSPENQRKLLGLAEALADK